MMLSSVEHEESFITSGPDHRQRHTHKRMQLKLSNQLSPLFVYEIDENI